MSKSMIEALCNAQYNALNAKDNKERIGYMIAGIKDGKFYDLKTDTNYGVYDVDAPDTVFIPKETLDLQRITGSKIASCTIAMQKFFEQYGSNPKAEPVLDESEAVEVEEAVEAEEAVEEAFDYEAVAEACKKAIKKGNVKKATKLLAKLEGQDSHKKLAKKLAKVEG